MKLRNWILFLFVAISWGSNWSVMKTGLSFVSPMVFVFHRSLFSTVALLPIVFLLRKEIPRDGDIWNRLFIYCSIFASQIFVTTAGLAGESSGIGAVLTFTQPLFVFCLAIPFLQEKATVFRLLGTLLGFAGVLTLLIGRVGPFRLDSSLILLLGAFLWAVSTVYYKKHLEHLNAFIANFFQLFTSVLPFALLNIFTGNIPFPRETTYLWVVLYSSIGSLAIGSAIWLFLLKEEQATVLSSSSFIVPVVAIFFGWLVLGEEFSEQSLIGTFLVLVGICLVNSNLRNSRTNAVA